MAEAKVLRLEDHRDKRFRRVQLAEKLYASDSRRLAVFRHLAEVAELCAADRAATVWVDEYGPGSVHPNVVLDHLTDRPRRSFSSESLRRAWELGVPGAIDALADPASSTPTTFAISLGSDGMRAWFLVAESNAHRPPLKSEARHRLMFLAGECAAVLLHRELDSMLEAERPEGDFPGWAILQDLEGRESDEAVGRRIAQRFVVGRVARMHLDDELVTTPERLAEQVRRARIELPDRRPADPEVEEWHRVLDLLDRGADAELPERLIRLGDLVERQAHDHGALEMYACAYEIAAALRLPRAAAEAARHWGNLLRRRAKWNEADARLTSAREIAELEGLQDVAARSMVGLSLMRQDAGNLPAAREGLEESLSVAEASGDPDTVAMVHHALMGVEQLAGDLSLALEHGWVAVATYQSQERRTRCVAGLAATLSDFGDLDAAEDAWSWVAHRSVDTYYQIYAFDALAYLSALRGDRTAFELYAGQCDALGWMNKDGYAKAEILYYRGVSNRALGDLERAAEWLSAAVTFAEEHKYNQVLFRAEEALASLAHGRVPTPPTEASPTPVAPPDLRDGLRAMRRELVSAEI